MINKKVAIVITPNFHDYGEKYLPEFLPSLRAQDYPGEIKYFITDNESSPESIAMLKSMIPEADIVCNKTNDGFAKGVNDSIRQALTWDFDYLVVINIDTVLEPSFVSELVKVASSDKKNGIVQGRVMLYNDRDRINSLGNASHFLGFGYCLGYREKFTNYKLQITNYIHYPSGVSILFTRQCLDKIGLFDEEYWMYNEDQEIGWRAWLAGFRCVLAPQAVLYHKYEFAKSIKQYYWMDRNRIITIFSCYRWGTLLLILPAFVIMELGLIIFALRGGWFKDKLRVWKYFLTPRTWKYLHGARKRNQNLRVVPDKKIAELIVGRIWYQEVDDWKLRFINPLFDLYWKVIKKIIVW